MALEDIYTELIGEHSRNPEHRHALPGATCSLKGHNPSCGDEITLELQSYNQAGVFKSYDKINYLYLVMPVRI